MNIDEDFLLFTTQTGFWQCETAKTAERMVSLYDAIANHGCKMYFVSCDEASCRHPLQWAIAERVEAQRPGSMLIVPLLSGENDYHLRWPRDGIQRFGERVVVADAPSERLATALGFVEVARSPWCEGGAFLRTNSDLITFATSRQEFGNPLAHNFKIIEMPDPSATRTESSCPLSPSSALTHLDLEINLAQCPDGTTLLLVSEAYWRAHRVACEYLAASLEARVFVVPPEECQRRAINLVNLPDGGVVIPEGCTQTQAFLERYLNQDVISIEIDDDFNFNGGEGGLRCMSSLLLR